MDKDEFERELSFQTIEDLNIPSPLLDGVIENIKKRRNFKIPSTKL